jgi:hypothetical protein
LKLVLEHFFLLWQLPFYLNKLAEDWPYGLDTVKDTTARATSTIAFRLIFGYSRMLSFSKEDRETLLSDKIRERYNNKKYGFG